MSIGIDFGQISAMAGKEFRDRIRNRWVLAVTLVFTAFAFIITYFGAASQGTVGMQNIEATIASLVSLVIYLLPLIALILGFDAIVGERERGSLDLLLAMPITRLELLLGKYLGLAGALTLSTLLGFGVVGAMIGIQLPVEALYHYAGFMLSAVLLGWAFLSLAVSISVFAVDRAQASGIAIALWFFFVLVFDLLLLGALVVSGGDVAGPLFPYLLLLNPADIFRILNIFGADDVRIMFGLTSIFPAHLANPLLLGSIMCGWIVLPLGLATWRFHR